MEGKKEKKVMTMPVRITEKMAKNIKELAEKKGIGYTTMARMIILENLEKQENG